MVLILHARQPQEALGDVPVVVSPHLLRELPVAGGGLAFDGERVGEELLDISHAFRRAHAVSRYFVSKPSQDQ
jgi:hypothetical protein